MGFHLQIDSIEDFFMFVAVIRGDEDADPEKLDSLVERIKTSNTKQETAVKANTPE